MENGYLRVEKLTVAFDSPRSVMFLKITKCTQHLISFLQMQPSRVYKKSVFFCDEVEKNVQERDVLPNHSADLPAHLLPRPALG